MTRFACICLTLEPLNELTIPCDEFEVDEGGNVTVYLNGELWGFFTSPEYVHIVDSDYAAGDDEEDEDEDENEDDSNDDDSQEVDESDAVSVVIPDDLSDLPEVSVSDEERDSR